MCMSHELIIHITMSVVFALLGVMLLLGKADFIMKRHIRESGKYNIPRQRVIHAIAFFIIVIMFILLACGVSEAVAVMSIMPVVVVVAILQYTWGRNR